MTSVQSQEDLEARIARIKKRNEEIEKKYREAEEDRLRAMKENAMVEIKPPKDDDWPREHKYDKIDFNYELDENTLAQLEERKKEKNAFIQKIAKEYKGFAEGEGPPPDPAYSFLADVERDGEKTGQSGEGVGGGSPNGNASILTANGRSPPGKGHTDHHFDRRNPNNRSGHRQGGGGTLPGQSGGRTRGGAKPQHGHHRDHHQHHGGGSTNIQRSFSTNEHDGWRSATGEQQRRNARGTTHVTHEGPGHWRRGEQQEGHENHRSKDDSGLLHASAKLEPSLTVSVTRDGEFKSVKGSGRVGPRQAAKPQFQFHTGHGDHNQPHGQHHLPLTTASAGRKETHPGDHFNRNTAGRKSDRGGESAKKTGPSANSSGKGAGSAPKSSSLQDRLNRNRTMGVTGGAATAPPPGSDKNENFIATKVNPSQPVVSGAAKATLKTISKIIEKNAEIDEKLARELARENEKLATKVKELRLQQEQ
ncbi:RNA-binding motif protein, X-linked-like-3 isoform X2 [Anopheles stephensi]|uniref:RNA-binding motif protein, X-linked-like-3 isoform X2 n=1 Tax=Anopheles stephensi TaxID=30069 RepID=UPI0016587F05|nr:RNA-binding motif protein, X-linked-like-3 isoform X2 [Anopheles stephensi]XP_035914845.1 RNA-binding motif protein, X-linked-like-3 isoform X2 [Anopheles stephensi]